MTWYVAEVQCLYCGLVFMLNKFDIQLNRKIKCDKCKETKMLKVTEIDEKRGDVFGYNYKPAKKKAAEEEPEEKKKDDSDDFDPFGGY